MAFYEITIRVRFHEVDSYGVLWHGSYISYLEEARLALSERFGLSIAKMNSLGVYAPVVEMKIRYKSFCRFGDILKIKTCVVPTERASLTFRYIIERESDSTIVAEAETTHVLLTLEGKLLYQPPLEVKEIIQKMVESYSA